MHVASIIFLKKIKVWSVLMCRRQGGATQVQKIYVSINKFTMEPKSSKLSMLCPKTIEPKKWHVASIMKPSKEIHHVTSFSCRFLQWTPFAIRSSLQFIAYGIFFSQLQEKRKDRKIAKRPQNSCGILCIQGTRNIQQSGYLCLVFNF